MVGSDDLTFICHPSSSSSIAHAFQWMCQKWLIKIQFKFKKKGQKKANPVLQMTS